MLAICLLAAAAPCSHNHTRVRVDGAGRWELDAQAQLTPFDPAKLPPTIVPVYAAKWALLPSLLHFCALL